MRQSEKQGSLQQWPVTLKDLVVAIPNHKITEPQLMAGRAARLVTLTCKLCIVHQLLSTEPPLSSY